MPDHVFVDESKKRDYLLVAAALPEAALADARRALRALLRPGQRRLHMVKESPSRQRQIVGVLREVGPAVTVYRAVSDGRSDARRRAACLDLLVADVVARGAVRLTLEREDSSEDRDRQVIYRRLSDVRPERRPEYRHARSHEELLLCVPDAIAWAWARDAVARRALTPLVDQTIRA